MRRLRLPPWHRVVNNRAIRPYTSYGDAEKLRDEEANATLDPTPLPAITRPAPYRVVSVSLFEHDVRILDETIARQIATGYPASRSSVVRMALRHFAARNK